MLTIVTGASANHFKTLCQFLINIVRTESQKETRVVVYDLGLSIEQSNWIKNTFGNDFVYEIFDYSKYPPHVNIKINAGEYAWKPIILHEVCTKYGGHVVWCDSGTYFNGRQTRLRQVIDVEGFYTPSSQGTIRQWTHPGTLRFLNWRGSLNLVNRTGGFVGVNCDCDWALKLVEDWKTLALIKDCIAPVGSHRGNHRQDQAVLTLLYYKYMQKYGFRKINEYFNFQTQKDVEPVVKQRPRKHLNTKLKYLNKLRKYM